MTDYTVTNPQFRETIQITEPTDPAHADNVNTAPKQIFENTMNLKKRMDDHDADAYLYRNGMYLPSVKVASSYTDALKADIQNGTFKKAFVGGYIEFANGHIYDFAHPDYWLHCGDTECTTHHMVVVPRTNLVNGKMNNSNVTTGGYPGSDFKTGANSNTALADIKAIIKADFGADNILTHRRYFANAMTNGKPSAGAWYDSDIDLMNEHMVYGSKFFEIGNDGSTVPYIYSCEKTQLKLFAERPDLICNRANWWLCDPVSATAFAFVATYGHATNNSASNSFGIRPAFAIC